MPTVLQQIQALQDKILASEEMIRQYQLSNDSGVADSSGYKGWLDYTKSHCGYTPDYTKSSLPYGAKTAECVAGFGKVKYNLQRIATETDNIAAWKAQVAQLSKSPEVQIAIQNATVAQISEQKRKTFLIIGGIVIAVIIIGGFIYFKWIKK